MGYSPNRRGVEAMLCAPFMVAEMARRAESGKELAEVIAPVYEDGPHPGRYKDGFETSSGVRQRKTRRAYGRLENTSPEAFFVEYGTKNNAAHHTLTQALEVMGE